MQQQPLTPMLDLRAFGVLGTMVGVADRLLADTARQNAAAALRQQREVRVELASQEDAWLSGSDVRG